MNKTTVSLLSIIAASNSASAAGTFAEAFTAGDIGADFRLRYESVKQDNPLSDAKALTLQTHVGYGTDDYKGFTTYFEMEDVRIVGGIDDYSLPPTGFKPGQFSVIPDPETTELDQGFIQYSNSTLTTRLGRQVITHNRQRFVSDVSFRQDRQTFDAFSINNKPVEALEINYSYINQRNRIFSEAKDIDSMDHLLNLSYKSPIGKLTGYGYLLEIDNNTDNALDTYGISLAGSVKHNGMKYIYRAEHATQESESGAGSFDADYTFLEGGLTVSSVTTKLGYEVLGSDSGAYAFSTPMGSSTRFNGWAGQFLTAPVEGLEHISMLFTGKLLGGKWITVYRDFSAEKPSATIDDLGTELDLMYLKKFARHYSTGIRYATYSAGDMAAGKVDTDKFWLWISASFQNILGHP